MTQANLDQYCVFGNPIAHSRSPEIHQNFAKETNQAILYKKQLVELDGFAAAVKSFIDSGGKGANVTVPFKEQALTLADQLSERAALAGAVNTLTFKNGKVYGDNTDGEGLVQDLIRNKVVLNGCRILIIGAGGAAKGVLLPLLSQQPSAITIANRTVSKAQQLCQHFSDKRVQACHFTEVTQQNYDLIINATSASLSGNLPAISSEVINANVTCYDMVYGQDETPFLKWAKEHGCAKTIDGLGMLVGQAAVSFSIWREVTPNTLSVINKLRASFVVN
ncbi:shikimate dehydrogenase [Colwelliaceae bacterium MEBiC 14330]